MSVLDTIVENTRREVAQRKRLCPEPGLRARATAAPPPRGFAARLRRPGPEARLRLIAEVKRASPSAGAIRAECDPAAVARAYAHAGAAAISVLTDRAFFGGGLDDLEAVRAAVDLPVLRKDFIIDPYQVLEARAAGADALLLIAACLSDRALAELLGCAGALGLDALVEAHCAAECDRAAAAGAGLIGINNRDLKTLDVRLDTALELRARLPAGTVAVAESGIRTAADAARLAAAGFDAILVGEALMREADPGRAARRLLAGEA